MTIAKSIRLLLAGISACIVVWAFGSVAYRAIRDHRARTEKPVTLTILHWGNAAENKIVQDLVDQYTAQHPHVRVIRIPTGDFDSKLKTMMAAGTPPDLFYLPPRLLPEMASLKLIRPIDDLLEADLKSNGRAWFDDFFPLLIEAFRYDTETERIGKGKLYGLPKDFTTCVFYVNLDLCKQAGVDVEAIQKNGWTWDEFEVAMRKITDLNGKPGFEDRRIYGGVFNLWPDTIRQMVWTFGGEFFGENFRDVTLDSPQSQEALELIVRTRIQDKTVFNATGIAKEGGQEFINGNIGFSGPVGRWLVPTYADIKSFKWDVVPLPYKSKEFASSQVFTTAWTISSTTPHTEEAYKLMKHLSSGEGARINSRLGLAIPPLKSVAFSDDFLRPAGLPEHRADFFLKAIDVARLSQIPREAEWERIVGDKITRSIQTGQVSPAVNAKEIEEAWLTELDSPLRRQKWSPINWNIVLSIGGLLLAALLTSLFIKAKREPLGPLDRAQERAGYAFVSPWVIGFLCLTLGPMLLSLVLSFTRWSAMVPLSSAESVGLANYQQLLTRDPTFMQSLRVTAYYVILAVPVGQLAALAVAMLMNQKLAAIAAFRTIYFVPSVVSGAALSVLWLQIYNNDYGLMNQLLRPMLKNPGLTIAIFAIALLFPALIWLMVSLKARKRTHDSSTTAGPSLLAIGSGALLLIGVALIMFGVGAIRPPNWFGTDPVSKQNDAMVWAIPGFVIMNLWGVGGGMIIYLAGLKGIPVSLYEAATVDGAGPLRKFWNVTLPMLSPLIFYNLIMGIIGSFQVFTQAFMMTGAGPDNATLFYVLQLYRQAFEFHNMGYASAMAWVLFVIVLLLTMLVFRGSRKLVYYEGLK